MGAQFITIQNEISRYESLKNQILEVTPTFKQILNTYQNIKTELTNSYNIDNEKIFVCEKISDNCQEIFNIINYLEKIIIPKINEKISYLRYKMNTLKYDNDSN